MYAFRAAIKRLPSLLGPRTATESPLFGGDAITACKPAARGDLVQDAFCDSGIPTHSPTRLVLGIDRLPGGFGPFILAPQNAIVPYEKISDRTGRRFRQDQIQLR